MSGLAILGAGAYGTALAIVAGRAGRAVTLWGRDGARIAAISAQRCNEASLPGAILPESVILTASLGQAVEAGTLVLAVPTQNVRAAARAIAPLIAPGTPLVAAAKGIEQGSDCFVTDILRMEAPEARPAILSGPSFAADMARGLPTAVTLAAENIELAQQLGAILSGPGFRIYHSGDVRGVEIGGAAKNVLAIAAGVVVGAGLGESARAALIARGFAELRRLALALGARPETLMGLSGLGDLILTASSAQSRNFSFGKALGEGRAVAALKAGGKLAEGVLTAPALVHLARRTGVDMPISEATLAILEGRLDVPSAIAAVIERPQKGE